MKRPTIYDVAQRAGVSKSLVSLVLQGSPRVSDERRAAVLDAVAELNYTPSRLAAGLAGTQTRSIGVIIDDFSNLWFVDALAGLRASLAEAGYALSVADASLNAHLGTDPVEAFRAMRVDGIVVAGEVDPALIARSEAPAVVLGVRACAAELPELPVIASDERGGGRLATEHLISLGHSEVVCLSAPGASAGARESGYRDAMVAAGLAPRVVRAANTGEAAARESIRGVLGPRGSAQREAAGPPPTAVFAVNDPMAVGVIGAARDAVLAVPGALAVAGYDDSPIAAYGLLSLTSVSGEPRALGEAAGRALIARIGGAAVASTSLPPRLVVRGSTAA